MIKEYKYIKDKYSWDDEFESDSGKNKNTNSPKIYDLRTPQKSLNKMEMYSDYTSGKFFNVEEDTQKRGALDSIQTKPTTSVKLVSKLASKHIATSIVDLIFLEESSRDKHSTERGSQNNTKTERTFGNGIFGLEDN